MYVPILGTGSTLIKFQDVVLVHLFLHVPVHVVY